MSALIDQYNSVTQTLRTSIAKLKFTKADGTVRTLVGSLHPSQLPPAKPLVEGEVYTPKAPNHELITVYDIEAKGWRSFKNINLVSITLIESLNKQDETEA